MRHKGDTNLTGCKRSAARPWPIQGQPTFALGYPAIAGGLATVMVLCLSLRLMGWLNASCSRHQKPLITHKVMALLRLVVEPEEKVMAVGR